jgi:phi13 family phage major tail protein
MDNQYGEIVGIDSLNVAQVTSDTSLGYIAGAVSYLAPAGEIQMDAKIDTSIGYYDNVSKKIRVRDGETTVKIVISGVPVSKVALYTGKPYDASKGIMIDAANVNERPYFAVSGRLMIDADLNIYQYFQFLKGKFSIKSTGAKTVAEKVDVKTVDLEYTAIYTEYLFTLPDATTKSVKSIFADTNDVAFTGATNWFNQVQTPLTVGTTPAAITITANPLNNATAVVISTKPVLTFNNALANYSAITLVKTTDSSVVAATLSVDAFGKIVTVNCTGNLTAATVYNIIITAVRDIYGQTLAATIIKFTTA